MKNIHVRHFILAALFLALIVQVFNTASLFMSYSNLADPYRQIAGYFVGLSFEFSIFICIYAGSRKAGGWFAIITFFCGILYHNHWPEVIIDYHSNTYYFPTAFLSSTLLQLMNSVLAWFLSELYIEKISATRSIQTLAELEQKIKIAKSTCENFDQRFLQDEQEYNIFLESKKQTEQLYTSMEKELSEWEHKRDTLKQEITTLQKQKAGASKGLTDKSETHV